MRIHLIAIGLLLAVPTAAAQDRGDDITRTFTVGSDATLDVSNLAGAITVTGGSSQTVTVTATKWGNPEARERVDVEIEQRRDRIVVRTSHRRWRGRGGARVVYDIQVPDDAEVSAESVSGNVTAEGIEGETRLKSVSGDVLARALGRLAAITSVSGDIEIAGATADRTLEVTTVSGSIDAADLFAPRLELNSVSGHVDLVGVTSDDVEAQSVSRHVDFSGPLSERGRYELQSHSGDIRIAISNDRGFELEARSFSGTIRTDPDLRFDGIEIGGGRRRSLEGQYGDGSARISAATFSGDVSLTKP